MLKGSVYCNISRTTALVVGLLLGLLPTFTHAAIDTNIFGDPGTATTPPSQIAGSVKFGDNAPDIIQTAAKEVLRWLLYFTTAAAVIMIIYAGMKLIQSGGNDEQAKESKRAVLYIVVGIIVLSCVFVIIQFGGGLAKYLAGETSTF